jgi:hypothetical protein
MVLDLVTQLRGCDLVLEFEKEIMSLRRKKICKFVLRDRDGCGLGGCVCGSIAAGEDVMC